MAQAVYKPLHFRNEIEVTLLTSGVAAASAVLHPIISTAVTPIETPMNDTAGRYPLLILRNTMPTGTPTAQILAAAAAAAPALPPWAALLKPPIKAADENQPAQERKHQRSVSNAGVAQHSYNIGSSAGFVWPMILQHQAVGLVDVPLSSMVCCQLTTAAWSSSNTSCLPAQHV